MLTKILTGGFILIMVGAGIAGAFAVFAPSEEACASTETPREGRGLSQGLVQGQGLGQGQGQGLSQGLVQEQGQGLRQGQDQGLRQGQGQSLGQGQGRNGVAVETAPLQQETVEGIVVETEELVIETTTGETVQVGLGPSFYRESQGFALQGSETVRVSGYWEDDEFKATQLVNLDTGQSIVLRDATGRPMWAGQGRGKNRSS